MHGLCDDARGVSGNLILMLSGKQPVSGIGITRSVSEALDGS